MLIAVGDIKEEPKVRGLIDQSFFISGRCEDGNPCDQEHIIVIPKILSETDNLRLSKNLTYLE